jgi:hypothetical protein
MRIEETFMSSLPARAMAYGLVMGIYIIAGVYLVVSLLPPVFGILIPVGALVIAVVFQWPHSFDGRAGAGWAKRLGRRAGFLASAAPVAAVTAFLIVAAVPGFLRWGERVHRESLERRGVAQADIQARLDAHRQTASHYLLDGALIATIPGAIGALVTTAAGAVVWRRRSSGTSSAWARDSDTPRSAS